MTGPKPNKKEKGKRKRITKGEFVMNNDVKLSVNVESRGKLIDFEKQEKMYAEKAADTLLVDDAGSADIIDNFLPTGLTFINADPKAGKSWMALNIAEAVATGKDFLGHHVNTPGDVSFFALESPNYKMKKRLQAAGMDNDDIANKITFYFEGFPYTLGNNMIEYMELIMDHRPNTKLIIIDTLVKVLSDTVPKGQNAYQVDYMSIDPLRRFGENHSIAILVLHHNNQRSDTLNAMHRASGSNGYPANSNAFYMLNVNSDREGVLDCTAARDVDPGKHMIRFNGGTCHWELTTAAEKKKQHQTTAERVFLEAPTTILARQLAALGKGLWEGTATEIWEYAVQHHIDTGCGSTSALSRKLNNNAEDLKKYAGLTLTQSRNRHGSVIKIEAK